MFRSTLLFSVLSLSVLDLSGCGVGEIDYELASLDETAHDLVRSGDYLDFEHVNAAPYRTALDDSSLIDVMVSPDAAGAYRGISPERSNSSVMLPEGAVIARVVLSPNLQPSKVTLMIKGPDQFFAGSGDWYYAVLELDGTFATLDDSQHGRASDCALCHAERSGDDFLFGVPATMR